ncbi:hypothetical protein HY003_00580 [Candidatus Saccharibacteria bacterium]|nr:hypothetical protein [Candidatus Saccharibacteria bacterium]MBI3337781.1 hypothetical protein [Candidatus Saccharibacteria bacterium]
MERGEILNKVQRLPLNIVRGVQEALQRRVDRKYGTLAERQATYSHLYKRCEELFTVHAAKVGTLQGYANQGAYQRLILDGMPGVHELIIDRDIGGNDEFHLVGMNTTMGSFENPVIYDRQILTVTPETGIFQTSHSETHYPPNFNPLDNVPYYKDTETKVRPLAAPVAQRWAEQINPNLSPIDNHILMSSATFENQ